MCQRSSGPTRIREVIQLSLWPARRLAGQATFTSPAVQLDARARPSGGHEAGDQAEEDTLAAASVALQGSRAAEGTG